MTEAPTQARRRRGPAHLIGTVAFGLVVTALTVTFSVQIIRQAWSPGERTADCRAGLASLLQTLDRARQSAASQNGEAEALAAFRGELGAAWANAPGLTHACAQDPIASRLLRSVVQLRYAEEHAIRYEARELAIERRRVEEASEQLFAEP